MASSEHETITIQKDYLITTTDAADAATIDTTVPPTTDAKGSVYRFTYDALNRKTSMTYPDGSQEKWTYDLNDSQNLYTTPAELTMTLAYSANTACE